MQRKLGVSPATTVAYSSYLRPFLRSLALNCIADIAWITASDSIRYIEEHAGDGSPTTAVAFCSRLRSFLRYLSAEGLVTEDLSAYVPLVKVPKALGRSKWGRVVRKIRTLRATRRGLETWRRRGISAEPARQSSTLPIGTPAIQDGEDVRRFIAVDYGTRGVICNSIGTGAIVTPVSRVVL